MSGRLSHQLIHRSITGMAVQLHDMRVRRDRQYAHERLAESDLQYQVDISGSAGGGIAWTDYDITFEHVIYQAPSERKHGNQLEEPHFHFGAVIESGPQVIVHANVKRWKQDSSGNFTGARVSIGAYDPNNSGLSFRGRVHLTFQGNSVPVDADLGESDG